MNQITLTHPLLLALTWAGANASAQEPAPQPVSRRAVTRPAEVRYPVILSSRWFHPTSPQDTLSTLKMVDAYHPDRLDWMYCTNDAQLAQLRARGVPYSLALNPQVPDSAEYTVRGRVVDLAGNKLVAPWMRNWKQKNANWGCVNAPEFREVFYAQSKKLLDLGAYGLFMDDARVNDQAVEWGGCFCDHCVRGFAAYLRANGADTLGTNFDYRTYLRSGSATAPKSSSALANVFRTFQRASVVRFLTDWRTAMETYAARPVTFLTNNYGGQWTEIYRVFDVGIGELPADRLNADYITARTHAAARWGKKQYFTLTTDSEDQQLLALFLTYAAGSALVVPWDVYVHSRSRQMPVRFFGDPQAFAPAYRLFCHPENAPTATASTRSRRARQSARGARWQVTAAAPSDSLRVVEYPDTDGRTILVQVGNARAKTHVVILQTTDDREQAPVRVVYPSPDSVRVRRQGNTLRVTYSGGALVLNFSQP